jgi:UDP-N-acetylmuramate--alanine ligase
VFGEHNILNSIAASAACVMLGVNLELVKKGLENFKGTHRRYEYRGTYKKAVVIDDYAHHPSEMKTTLLTAKTYSNGKIITIFQPHTYSRTIALLDKFAEALKLSDETILLDIYAARETDKKAIHSIDLVNKIKKLGANAVYATSFEEAVKIIDNIVKKDDTVIAMGAGNVNDIIELLEIDKQ